jgi:rhodanese-related sulfurtransferase
VTSNTSGRGSVPPVPIEEITVEELAPLLEEGAVLVDVRNVDEWVEARVPGVQLIPLGEFEARHPEVPPADTVYVICRSGARSMRACQFLAAQGRTAVNVAGGTLAWIDSGRPVESGPDGA